MDKNVYTHLPAILYLVQYIRDVKDAAEVLPVGTRVNGRETHLFVE